MKKVIILAILVSLVLMACAKKEEEKPTPTGPVVVGIVESEGKPVEGATVAIEALGVSVTTDANGSFKLTGLVEGSYEIYVEKEGYAREVVRVAVGPEETLDLGKIEIELAGSISGIARLEDTDIFRGISIAIRTEDGKEVTSTKTDDKGSFEVRGLKAGSYILVAEMRGYESKEELISVSAGKTTTIEISLKRVGSRLSDDFNGRELDPKWTALDIGTSGGGQRIANGVLRVAADGEDIWGTSDEFRFIYQKIDGDFEAELKIISIPAVHEWSKGGIMVRQDISPGSPHALIQHNSGHGLTFQFRTSAGVDCSEAGEGTLPNSLPVWVRIERKGDRFTAYGSPDGKGWTQIGMSVSIPMTDPVLIGIALTSHVRGTVAEGDFDDFVVRQ